MKRLILINLLFVKLIFAQISPGELSKDHSKLEGLQNCTKCHTLGEGLSNQKCFDCHKEIKFRIEKNLGYHSSSEVKGKQCWKCHSEHNGKNFKLISFHPKKFDHNKTGYELTGKHKLIDCSDCHNHKYIKDQNLSKEKTYLGLNRNCISCHEDVHQQTAGEECSKCHNTTSFINQIKFDHDKTVFPLIGSHKTLNCTDCHKKAISVKSTVVRFVSNKNPLCTDCHIDIHKNKFGQNCLTCHNFNSFRTNTKQKFDHSRTGFELIGKHQFIDCKKCHIGKLTDPLKHNKCNDCHTDYHRGEFVKNNILSDCKDCHTEDGFTPSNFSLENHQKFKFILTGAHLAIQCSDCHRKQKEWKFKFISFRCIDCHQNVHNQEINIKFMGNYNCENCHNTINWSDLKFDHNKTNFPLEGKHSKITCRKCHILIRENRSVHLFKSLKSGCLDCHNDIHYKQYISEECRFCHSFDQWVPTIFNHNQAEFKLTGAHEKVECIKCHIVEKKQEGGTYILYKIRRTRCSDCHFS